jgi:hypothetical protein
MIQDYEANLKLYNESIRKDLDVILSSIIPTQKNLMKTLLWINSVILGLLTSLIASDIESKIILMSLSIPYFFSFMAIIILLLSLKDGRVKAFGTPNISDLENIQPSIWAKSQGLTNINNSIKQAFDINSNIVAKRGRKIAQAINFTIASVIFIFLMSIAYSNFILKRGGNIVSENKKNTDFDKRPKMSQSTSKPETMLATNNRNIEENQQFGFITAGMESLHEKSESKKKDSSDEKRKKD